MSSQTLSTTLRLGTRRSRLAVTQSALVADALRASTGVGVDLVQIVSEGDLTSAPLAQLGGVGVFVGRLRTALLAGEVDLAVHSLKDLPTAPAPGLVTAATPARHDPRDVLVARDGLTLAGLPAGARVGTGSPRRAAQLRALGRGLEPVELRGNVDTRLQHVADGRLDAVVLAAAGLARIGRDDAVTEYLDPAVMLPAPGQGALALECAADRLDVRALLEQVHDPATSAAVTAERTLLARLEGGCAAPIGALAHVVPTGHGPSDARITLEAVLFSPCGTRHVRRRVEGTLEADDWAARAADLGRDTADDMLAEAAVLGLDRTRGGDA